MTDPAAVTVTLQHNTPVVNASGSETAAWANVTGAVNLACRIRNRRPGPHTWPSEGGGQAIALQNVLIFAGTGPTIPADLSLYRFVCSNGRTYLLVSYTQYKHTAQAVVEVRA